MKTIDVSVKRLVYESKRSFDEVLAALSAGIGHPPFQDFIQTCYDAPDAAGVQARCAAVVGPYDVLEFFRLNMGRILVKYPHDDFEPKAVRIIAGNPAIMASMAMHVPDAAAYAPVTILIDLRTTGVHVSYDSMESLLAPYRNESVQAIARDLDSKIEALIQSAL